MIRMLLDRGAEIDSSNGFGARLLLTAVKAGRTPVVRLVLDQGATVEATAYWRDFLGFRDDGTRRTVERTGTVLHLAVRGGPHGDRRPASGAGR